MRLHSPIVPSGVRPLSPQTLEARLDGLLCKGRVRKGRAKPRLLLAVSGGPDSLALLCLGSRLSASKFDVFAATVDHGLRKEGGEEAAYVADLCRSLGVPHQTLGGACRNGRGNLQAHARALRYRLLADHAVRIGAHHVLTAHHADDQRETALHAIERGDHERRWAGMRSVRALEPGLDLARPFLTTTPAALYAVVREQGIMAVCDPSNDDDRFARVRNRRRLGAMSVQRRGEIDAQQRRAFRERERFDTKLAEAFGALLTQNAVVFDEAGGAHLSRTALCALDLPLADAMLSRLVTAVGGARIAPPRESIGRLSSVLRDTGRVGEGPRDAQFAATLAGARLSAAGDTLQIMREFGRAGPETLKRPYTCDRLLFDNRFDLVMCEQEKDMARQNGAVLCAYGAVGRGNRSLRPLPVLMGEDGALLAGHPDIVRRERARGSSVPPFTTLRSRVRWRALADLAVSDA